MSQFFDPKLMPWHSPGYLDVINARKRPPLRLVGILRISQDKEDSGSIDVQKREEVELAEERGAVIVDWAEDRDISATKVPIYKRPQLKEFLSKRSEDFDGFLAWKLDRLTRNSSDTRRLVLYMEENNKVLWSVVEAFFRYDPNAVGVEKIVADLLLAVLTMVNEMESNNISVRQKGHRRLLKESARWPGGPIPYWLASTKSEDNKNPLPGESLRLISDRVAVMLKMIEMFLDGHNTGEIARYLTSQGHVPPKRARLAEKGKTGGSSAWYKDTVFDMLGNRMLIGQIETEDGVIAVDKTGKPIQYCKGIVDIPTFERIQQRRAQLRKSPRGPGSTPRGYAGLVKCAGCGTALRIRAKIERLPSGPKLYAYYYCPRSKYDKYRLADTRCTIDGSMRMEPFDSLLETHIRENLALRPLTKDIFVKGSGSHEELSILRSAIANMISEQAKAYLRSDEFLIEAYRVQIETMRIDLARLESLGVTPSRWESTPTGGTFLEAWDAATVAGRRELLENTDIVFRVDLDRTEMSIEDPLDDQVSAMIRAKEQGEE